MAKEGIKKLGIQMSQNIFDRLQEIADRYGITPNSLITYVIGQWVDSNYDMRDKLSEKMVNAMVEKITGEFNFEGDSLESKMANEALKSFMNNFSSKLEEKK